MTLKEIIEKDLIDAMGRFIDSGTKKRLNIIEAISSGVLDPNVRHIVDPEEKDVISLNEAMERGIIDCKGRYIHPITHD